MSARLIYQAPEPVLNLQLVELVNEINRLSGIVNAFTALRMRAVTGELSQLRYTNTGMKDAEGNDIYDASWEVIAG